MFSPRPLVIGLDVGGTSTRVLLADVAGNRLGTGLADGGNPVSRGRGAALANIADAVGQAIDGYDAAVVESVVVGIAGALSLQAHFGEDIFDSVWERLGLRCRVGIVGDAVVAFSAGTPRADGTVLIAGTGAIAARVDDHELSTRDDGYGWLLGDLGSGFWLGRQAVHHTLRHLGGLEPEGALTRAVLERLSPDGTTHTVDSLVGQVMSDDPIRLSTLAPLVTEAAEHGDPLASAIAEEAVDLLCAKVRAVRRPGEATPIVLAGSLLARETPIAAGVAARLAETFPDASIHVGRGGAGAAAWLAARHLVGGDEAARLHEVFTA